MKYANLKILIVGGPTSSYHSRSIGLSYLNTIISHSIKNNNIFEEKNLHKIIVKYLAI